MSWVLVPTAPTGLGRIMTWVAITNGVMYKFESHPSAKFQHIQAGVSWVSSFIVFLLNEGEVRVGEERWGHKVRAVLSQQVRLRSPHQRPLTHGSPQ